MKYRIYCFHPETGTNIPGDTFDVSDIDEIVEIEEMIRSCMDGENILAIDQNFGKQIAFIGVDLLKECIVNLQKVE